MSLPTAPLPGAPLREFESLHTEHDYLLSDEVGSPPPGLRGTLYRNGAGRWESGGSPAGHVFDGDGMLSMFVFEQGKVRFRNRYVRTTHYVRGYEDTGPAGRGTGTMRAGGFLANAFRWPLSNQANTNAVLHAGQLLALWEGGKPHSIDPDTLATNGIHDFGGRLRGLGAFSAHPKIDHRTGELFNFGVSLYPLPGLAAYRVDPSGNLRKLAHLPMSRPLFNHDVGLTNRYLVFVLDPKVVSPVGMLPVLAGLKPLATAISFDARLGTKIVLVPRDGGRKRVAHTDTLLHFHLANCYDDGDDTVIELCRYTESFDTVWRHFGGGFDRATETPTIGGPLTRLRVTKNGRVLREDLTDSRTEFPQVDARFTGQHNRYTYAVQLADADTAADTGAAFGISTFDHQRGTESTYRISDFGSAGEPVFAPRSPDAAEGDGWLLTLEYDRTTHRSKLVVLDATAPQRGPVYVGGLQHHLPIGLHGSFTPRVAVPR